MAYGIGSRYRYAISATHTLDGVKVEPGLRVWDNDLHRCEVIAARPFPDRWEDGTLNVWWEMRDIATGQPSPMQDASRMTAWHPSTGERA